MGWEAVLGANGEQQQECSGMLAPPTVLTVVAPSTTVVPLAAAELKFIKSPWSTPCLVLNDYLYNCHSTRGDIGYWRCHNYSRKVREERCRARCVVKGGRLRALTGAQHNHPPHTEKIERIVRRNHADEQQELLEEEMRMQQQQQQQEQENHQQTNNKASQHGGNILLLMTTTAATPSATTQHHAEPSPSLTDLIKMEEYELPSAVEM